MALRVIQAFGGNTVGDEITDAATIADVLASDQAGFVVAVADPEKPAKAPPAPTDTNSAS